MKSARERELAQIAEQEGLSFRPRNALEDTGVRSPVDPSVLPRYYASCVSMLEGVLGGRRVLLFDCVSEVGKHNWITWLLTDSDTWDLVFGYTCAATQVGADVPNCVLIGPSQDERFNARRYRCNRLVPLSSDGSWRVGIFGGPPLMEAPPWVESFFGSSLENWLEQIPRGWHFRLSPPWIICVGASKQGEESAFVPPDDLLLLSETLHGLLDRVLTTPKTQ